MSPSGFIENLPKSNSTSPYFESFQQIGLSELNSFIFVKSTISPLDPILSKPLKAVTAIIYNSILIIMSQSLVTSYIPQSFKVAVIKPPIKKTHPRRKWSFL